MQRSPNRSEIIESVERDDLDVLRILFKQNPNRFDGNLLNHILLIAVDHRNDEMINYVMGLGANGNNGILCASSKGDMQSIRIIEKCRQDNVYAKALTRALKNGHFEVAKWAIGVCEHLNLEDALIAAAQTSIETLEWLVGNVMASPAEWDVAIGDAMTASPQFVEGALPYLLALGTKKRSLMLN